MKKFQLLLCSIIFLFNFSLLCAQTIKGKVTHLSQPAHRALVILRNSAEPNKILQYKNTNQLGEFEFVINTKIDSIIIEASSLGLEKDMKHLSELKNYPNPIIINFDLIQASTTINEVIVSNNSITKRDDTITYLPSRFKDGSERVIEDLLKKLPGIAISDNGEVKYKGKAIEKMFLDGTDLFSKNYVLGTRNIDVEMVEKVQAIENFVENDLLKNLVNSDDVAINIQLKKGKTDLSGNGTLGSNFENRHLIEATALVINKKFKSFSMFKNNSIGKNFSAHDLANPYKSYYRETIEGFLTPTLLSEGNFNTNLDENYERLNTTNHLSNNTLFKIKKNVVRFTFELLDEKFSRDNHSITNYFNEHQTKVTLDNFLTKKPRLYTSTLFVENKANKNFHWQYDLNFHHLNSNYSNIALNNELQQNTHTDSKNNFFNQKFQFTQTISEKSALIGHVMYLSDKNSQDQNIFNASSNSDLPENQLAELSKRNIYTEVSLFTKSNQFKYKNALSFTNQKNDAFTQFNTTLEFDGFLKNNKISYNKSVYLLTNAVDFSNEKFKLLTFVDFQYFNLSYRDFLNFNDTRIKKLYVNPSLSAAYILVKDRSSFRTNIIHTNENPNEQYLLSGLLQTDYRNYIYNKVDFSFSKSWRFDLSYQFSDYFNKRYFTAQYFQNRQKNYITTKNQVFDDYNITEYFLNSDTNFSQGINLNYEEYASFIKSTVNFNANFSQNIFENIFDESQLREVKVNSMHLYFKLLKKISRSIYIDNAVTYSLNQFLVSNSSHQNRSGLNNNFKIVYNAKPKLIFTTNFKYYQPDLNSATCYYFLDSEASYQLKIMEVGFIAKNLFNNSDFITKNVSDISASSYQQTIMNPYVMLFTRFRF